MQKPQMSYEELNSKANEVMALLKDLQSRTKWEKVKSQPCEISTMSIEDRLISRGIAVVNFSIETVINLLEEPTTLKGLNDTLVQCQNLLVEKEFKVIYMQYSATWPVAHRDIVTVGKKMVQSADKCYIGSTSCNYQYPERKSVVRAHCYVGGYIIQKVSENQTKVTYISDVDIKGLVPQFAKNSNSIKQGQVPSKIDKLLKKK